jgi:hypothetical protein
VLRPFAIQQFFREFFEALRYEAGSFFGYPRPLEVLEDSPKRLVAEAGRGELIVDKGKNSIQLRGRVVAPIRAVTAIEVRQCQNGDGPEVWKLSLVLLRERKVEVARLFDDTEASILGAKLATLTEKHVVVTR